ncbi:MAG: hypothetical protein JWO19_2434 [Bryobacterales bacterium]|nr:hypothetical protein [Bryobacterales bacterium]
MAIAQIALTFLLLSEAGLMLRTYRNLSHSDPGFQTSHALTFHLGAAWDEDRDRVGRIQAALLDKLSVLPGVQATGFANFLPASGATLRYQFRYADNVTAGERSVTRDYFKAIGTPVVSGDSCPVLRSISNATPKALVNRRFVNQFFNGQNPIGRTLKITDSPPLRDNRRRGGCPRRCAEYCAFALRLYMHWPRQLARSRICRPHCWQSRESALSRAICSIAGALSRPVISVPAKRRGMVGRPVPQANSNTGSPYFFTWLS